MSETDETGETGEQPYDGPEAPAWVCELLAGLPADDPPIPDDVAARLDATLATLAAGPAGAAPGGATAGDRPGESDGASDRATVVPLAGSARHRAGRPDAWGHRLLLGGVAAAAVVVLGGLGIVAVQRGSTPAAPVAGGLTTSDGSSRADRPPVKYVSSGLAYTGANIVPATQELLAAADEVAPEPGTPTPAVSIATTPATVPTLVGPLKAATERPDQACVAALTGSAEITPLVVDAATFDGHPAFVVVVATTSDTTTVDVWVVQRGCSAGAEGLLTFARVAR